MDYTSWELIKLIKSDACVEVLILIAFVEDYVPITKVACFSLVTCNYDRTWSITTVNKTVYIDS